MGLWENMKNIMTIPDDDDDFEDNSFEEPEEKKRVVAEEPFAQKKPESVSPKILKPKTAAYGDSQLQVVLVKPERFEDVRSIADNLNAGKTVVLNLESANRDESRRIVDFLSGVAYANHGNMRKVANSTFIIVAKGVDVMGELMLEDYGDPKLYF